ncbi:MAG: hypothetical protein IJ640_09405 [Prevotella sp.]|nr:hypothetical protein [Prevotella sp.]
MRTIDNLIIAFFALLALASIITAIVFGAWWHYGTGAMSAAMAWVMYKYD